MFCPSCNMWLIRNKGLSIDEKQCLNCGWEAVIYIEDGKKYGYASAIKKSTGDSDERKKKQLNKKEK